MTTATRTCQQCGAEIVQNRKGGQPAKACLACRQKRAHRPRRAYHRGDKLLPVVVPERWTCDDLCYHWRKGNCAIFIDRAAIFDRCPVLRA